MIASAPADARPVGVTTQTRRRSRAPSRFRLVERDWELRALEQCLTSARGGAGGTVFIEASAGTGKTRLLGAAREMAKRAGMQVVSASGSKLEQQFPFGLAIQLFEPLWLAGSAEDRASLLAGPADLASELFDGRPSDAISEADGPQYPLIHGLFWFARNLASQLPELDGGALAVLVDNAQWSDGVSLRYLAYLAQRIAELPIALVLTARPGEPCSDSQALTTLRRTANGSLLRPGQLSGAGVMQVVRKHFPGAEPAFCAACARSSGGNPFLLIELLNKLIEDEYLPGGDSAEWLDDVVPDKVRDSVAARLHVMDHATRAVAKAVAVLGDAAAVSLVARLAGVDSDTVLEAADALAAVELLRRGSPLSFVNPLIRSAVSATTPKLEHAQAHRLAATILTEEDASAEQIATHLLKAPPTQDQAGIDVLRQAAARALESGRPKRAVELLQRGLAEDPNSELRIELVTELRHAESQVGESPVRERRQGGRRMSDRPEHGAEFALAQGRVYYAEGRYREAAGVLDAGRAELGEADDQRASELSAAYISAASVVGELHGRALEVRDQMLAALSGRPSPAQRAAIAHTAVHDCLGGAGRDQVRRLTDLAWGDGALLETEVAQTLSWPLLSGALIFADELERAVEICDAVLGAARREHSSFARATVSSFRSWARYEQGSVAAAEGDADAAAQASAQGRPSLARIGLGVTACCYIERGQLDQAETVLTALEGQEISGSLGYPLLLEVRAQLNLAQHRPQEALQNATQAGLLVASGFAGAGPGAVPWRSTAALAHLAMGEPDRARALAEDELADARRTGVTRSVIRNLRILGLARGGKTGIDLLVEAVTTGDSYPARLEHTRALVDLGAALRRGNRRVDAREPLRRGLDLSNRSGATVLAARAQTELLATGARPRGRTFSGVESLTASQRRVAELAARGLTTRQMAEALFVTPKTIEFHLRQTYQKLDVTSREQLEGALSSG
jgi:DNA-binding CsgD family transcriptional regulator